MTGRSGMLLLFFFFLLSPVRASTASDPCADLRETDDLGPKLERAKMQVDNLLLGPKPAIKGYESEGMLWEWNWVKALQVMGLDGREFADVLSMLDDAHCSFVAWGDAVWKTVRRLKPTVIEGDAVCDLKQLEKECVERFGWNACTLVPAEQSSSDLPYVQIGRYEEDPYKIVADPVRVYPRGSRWKIPPQKMAFTVDTMALVDGLDGKAILVDVSGRGVYDACERNLYADVSVEAEQPDDLLRYFELRSYDFRPADPELRAFIERELRNGSVAIDEVDWREWYCESEMVGGVSDTVGEERRLCWRKAPSAEERKRAAAATEAMKEDTPYFWSEIGQPGIVGLEDVQIDTAEMHEKKYGETKRQRVVMKDEKESREAARVEKAEIRAQTDSVRENRVLPTQNDFVDYDALLDSASPPSSSLLLSLLSLIPLLAGRILL